MGNYMENHSPIGTTEPMRNMMNEVHLLSPKGIEYIMKPGPPMASNVQTVQTASKYQLLPTTGRQTITELNNQ